MLSRFSKIIPLKNDKLCLFSTRFGSSVIIEEKFFKKIQEGTISREERDILSSLGILVDDQDRELEEVLNLIDKINKTRKILSLLIVLNLDCNLSCAYCYEGTQKGNKYLNNQTTDEIINFINQEMAKGKGISIDFYGGEPLLSYETILYFMKRLNESAKEHRVNITYNLVTNGTLLTKEKVNKLKKLGLNSVKITLDGDESNHNIFRPYRNGMPSFKKILENIKNASSFLNIQLGGNYTKENYKDFPKLLDRLISEGITPDKLSIVKFDPVTAVDKKFSNPEFKSGCLSLNEFWIAEASIYLREEILKRGYNTIPILPSVCVVEINDELVINYNGDVYKCPGFLGMEELKVGNVFTGIDQDRKKYDLSLKENKKCMECIYLPMCFGGCRYISYLKKGKFEIDCKIEYFENTLNKFVTQDIKYKQKII